MSHAGSAPNIPKKTRLRLDKNVADARLESTSPSTDVFITVFFWNILRAAGWLS